MFAISPASLSAYSKNEALGLYETVLSSPLVHPTHLNRVIKSIHGFFTTSQILPIARGLIESLDEAWLQLRGTLPSNDGGDDENASGNGSRAHTTSNTPSTNPDAKSCAISFSLSVRIACVVLSSLPIHSVPQDTRDELQQLFDGTIHTGLVHKPVLKIFRIVRKSKNTGTPQDDASLGGPSVQAQASVDIWGLQIAASACLRLHYALNTSTAVLHLKLNAHYDMKMTAKMVDITSDGTLTLLPELRLEIVRSFSSFSCPVYPILSYILTI